MLYPSALGRIRTFGAFFVLQWMDLGFVNVYHNDFSMFHDICRPITKITTKLLILPNLIPLWGHLFTNILNSILNSLICLHIK